MTDIFDLFTDRAESYGAQVWQYKDRLSRISGLGGFLPTVADSKQLLQGHLEQALSWIDEHIDNGLEVLACRAYDEGLDLAVVYRVETGAVVSYAMLKNSVSIG